MRWVLAFLCVLGATAHADTVGIVVSGDPAVQGRITAEAGRWVGKHGFTLAPGALDAASITRLLDCLTIDDTVCASAVVAENAHAESILAISAEAVRGKRDVTINAHWLRKRHNAGSVRRVCEACSDASLAATVDTVLSDLTRTEPEVPPAKPHARAPRSRTIPAIVIGAGVATVITGGVLFATSEDSTGVRPTYRDTKPAGIGVAIGGGVILGVGVFLLLRGDHSGPTVEVAAGRASAGWMGRF